MPVHTRFSHLSDIEFERELEHRTRSGQMVLGTETTRELMERVRAWVDEDQESELETLRDEVEELKGEVADHQDTIRELQKELEDVRY